MKPTLTQIKIGIAALSSVRKYLEQIAAGDSDEEVMERSIVWGEWDVILAVAVDAVLRRSQQLQREIHAALDAETEEDL
jgi:hypothetical protein